MPLITYGMILVDLSGKGVACGQRTGCAHVPLAKINAGFRVILEIADIGHAEGGSNLGNLLPQDIDGGSRIVGKQLSGLSGLGLLGSRLSRSGLHGFGFVGGGRGRGGLGLGFPAGGSGCFRLGGPGFQCGCLGGLGVFSA